jgi:hypothetical protein
MRRRANSVDSEHPQATRIDDAQVFAMKRRARQVAEATLRCVRSLNTLGVARIAIACAIVSAMMLARRFADGARVMQREARVARMCRIENANH